MKLDRIETFVPRTPENDVLFEYDRSPNPLRDELLVEGFRLEGESVRIPQGPGLGVEIDPEVLERYTAARGEARR